MAGHSKWSNIKRKKARVDAIRGKQFSKIAKDIIIAVKSAGDDPRTNPQLRIILQKAKYANMGQAVIDRHIQKALHKDTKHLEPVVYELYGHGGLAMVCCGTTDNKNRSAGLIREALSKKGGVLATPGSVLFNFEKVVEVILEEHTDWIESVSAFDPEDFILEDRQVYVWFPFEKLAAIEQADVPHLCDCRVIYRPHQRLALDEEMCSKNSALLEVLETIDDLDDLFHNGPVSL